MPKFHFFFQMSWRSQGQKNLVHNMSLNLLFFSSICKLCPGDFQATLFWSDIVPKFHFFFQMSWRSQGQKNLVHNMSLNLLFFSSICKLCPGDFQATLFWSDIVPKFHLFFFQMSWRSQGQKNLVHNMSLNLLFFQLFVNFVLAISRPFYFGLTLCLNLT